MWYASCLFIVGCIFMIFYPERNGYNLNEVVNQGLSENIVLLPASCFISDTFLFPDVLGPHLLIFFRSMMV